ncbi:hypothetical protein EXIGLDRAFT_834286 [Exidia glandulosa HHB12029]|uniref:DUF6534 domain-containing protein n=1 Tax=Exidia glandulosa HHB12029 TaxID=1314781 RepID=A0A165JX39_EXIGL|nr:hypothetical protein EXIGLDRAFT_834286 [Exidia glandulosa HHB12029]
MEASPGSSIPVLRPDLSLTYGAFEIGILIGMFLTGIATLQAWNYARDYQEDSKRLKILVTFVYFADLLHSAMLAHTLYWYTIRNFGLYAALGEFVWSFDTATPLAGIVAFVVQTFFCARIKHITGTWTYAIGCWILAAARLVLNCVFASQVVRAGVFSVLGEPKTKALGLATLSVGAASDVLIAGFLCAGFSHRRSGFAPTDKLLNKLVAYTIGTGLITSIIALCEAITFGASGTDNLITLSFYCVLPKLFRNSLLASLNERSYTRRDLTNLVRSTRSKSITIERTTVSVSDRDVELGALQVRQPHDLSHDKELESPVKRSSRDFQ